MNFWVLKGSSNGYGYRRFVGTSLPHFHFYPEKEEGSKFPRNYGNRIQHCMASECRSQFQYSFQYSSPWKARILWDFYWTPWQNGTASSLEYPDCSTHKFCSLYNHSSNCLILFESSWAVDSLSAGQELLWLLNGTECSSPSSKESTIVFKPKPN